MSKKALIQQIFARMAATDGHCVWSDLLDEPTGSSGGIRLGAVIVAADAQGGAMVLPRFSVSGA